MINRHIKSQLANMCQSYDIVLDRLYCGKWRKISKSRCDLDLDRTMPNVELFRASFIYYHVQVSSRLNHYFLSYRVHRHTDGKTERHADGHEYSIVAVDKQQL